MYAEVRWIAQNTHTHLTLFVAFFFDGYSCKRKPLIYFKKWKGKTWSNDEWIVWAFGVRNRIEWHGNLMKIGWRKMEYHHQFSVHANEKKKKTTHNQMDSWKQLTQTVQYVTRFYQNAQKNGRQIHSDTVINGTLTNAERSAQQWKRLCANSLCCYLQRSNIMSLKEFKMKCILIITQASFNNGNHLSFR